MNGSEKRELPWWQKYTLTLNEASEYFGIGYKKLKIWWTYDCKKSSRKMGYIHILFYVFRKYQEEGKISEHISYNV